MMHKPSLTFRYRFMALGLLLITFKVSADEGVRSFDIPAQPLADALLQYSETSGTKVFFSAGNTQQLKSVAVKGRYKPEQALQKLLQDSGLHVRRTHADTVTVERAAQPVSLKDGNNQEPVLPLVKVTAKQEDNGSDTTLPKVTVEADADNPYDDPTWQTDPYNTDYVLPKATAGTKTNTPVMETPLNVQVISKQVLKDQQVIRLDQALRNVSGVTTTRNTGSDSFSGQRLFLRGFESSTLFRNGFRMDGNILGNGQQFANVESVEVLKGPASILYGRVEPGGMVNITTKQPRATPYYSFNQQFGSYDLYRTSIDATGPLTQDDTLLYRVNTSFQSNNSFRDLVSDEDVFFAPILKWNISPRTQATLEMEYQREISRVDQQLVPYNSVKKQFEAFPPSSRNYGERNPLETENIFAGFNWSHQFNDDWSIKHQTIFKRQENQVTFPLPVFFDLDSRQVTRLPVGAHYVSDTYATNLDLTGHFKTWGLEHTLLLGGDYYRNDFSRTQSSADGVSTISLDNPVHPGIPSGNLNINPATLDTQNTYTDNYGLYLQDQIKLPYNFHVTGGFRYQYVHVASERAGADGVFKPDQFSPPQTDDAVTPRVGLLWQPQKWLSLYSNYAENFGINAGAFDFTGKILPPQSAQQWEVGAKTELFDGRFRASLAYYDLTKQNVPTADKKHATLPRCAVFGCSIAQGEVHSSGPELDIQGEILPSWNVIATYANQDVRVTKSENGDVGRRLQFTPRNVGNFWTTYEIQKGDFKGFKIGGGVNLQDSVVNQDNSIKSPGYALVGLMAGYSFDIGKAKINAQLNIDNLLDKSYVTNIAPELSFADSNIGSVSFSTLRTIMGSINVEY